MKRIVVRKDEKNENSQISMIVFDWAGTTVDYGSCAPMDVFKIVFDEAGVMVKSSGNQWSYGIGEKNLYSFSLIKRTVDSTLWKRME